MSVYSTSLAVHSAPPALYPALSVIGYNLDCIAMLLNESNLFFMEYSPLCERANRRQKWKNTRIRENWEK